MRYSVTGAARELTDREKLFVMAVIAGLEDVSEITTGAAYGVDTVSHQAAVLHHPGMFVYKRLVVPAAPHNGPLVLEANRRGDSNIIEWAEQGETHAKSYMIRNDRLVHHADVLIAFPETEHEQLRSGTWATIRRARKIALEVRIHPLAEAREPAGEPA